MRHASFFAPLGLALTALIFAPACDSGDDTDTSSGETTAGDGDGDGDSSGSGSGGDSEGTTPCGMFGDEAVSCPPGQYCADSVLSMCENGCLSNENCASDQTCEKADGEDVGTCQNNDATTTGAEGPTEEEFCDKLLICDMSGTMEQCSIVYAGTNVECHQCIIDGNCGDINDGSCDAACGI